MNLFLKDSRIVYEVQDIGLCLAKLYKQTLIAIKKNAGFWDVMPCHSHKNRPFGGTYRFHHQDDKNRQCASVASYCLQCS
jgi:hypothetical protein